MYTHSFFFKFFSQKTNTEYWVEFLVLYSRSPLANHFIYTTVCICQSKFISVLSKQVIHVNGGSWYLYSMTCVFIFLKPVFFFFFFSVFLDQVKFEKERSRISISLFRFPLVRCDSNNMFFAGLKNPRPLKNQAEEIYLEYENKCKQFWLI